MVTAILEKTEIYPELHDIEFSSGQSENQFPEYLI